MSSSSVWRETLVGPSKSHVLDRTSIQVSRAPTSRSTCEMNHIRFDLLVEKKHIAAKNFEKRFVLVIIPSPCRITFGIKKETKPKRGDSTNFVRNQQLPISNKPAF